MKQLKFLLAFAAATITLCGCGGGSNNATGAGTTGRMSLSVVWPKQTRLIPIASRSIRAVVTSGSQTLATKLIVGSDGPPSSPQVITFDNLQPGTVTLTATAFPETNGTGVAQATGAQSVSIISGQTSSVTVTMASTIDHVTIKPANPTVAVGPSFTLTMTAFDAAGSIVLAPLTASFVSANTANVSETAGGDPATFQGLKVGTSLITVTETESGKTASTTATVSASGGQIVAWGDDSSDEVSRVPTGTGFVSISAGGTSAYALSTNGTISAWGSNIDEQLDVTGSGFLEVAGCTDAVLLLAANGGIVTRGLDDNGLVSNPPQGTGFTAIACGSTGSTGYVLKPNGSIIAWGDNQAGQVTNAPTGTGFTAVSGGFQFAIALASNGSIVAWGSNSNGQVSSVPTGTGFIAIAAGGTSGYALKANGSIVAWGNDSSGQVSKTPTASGFTAIAGGFINGYALTASGGIVAWGDNSAGQVTNAPKGTGFTDIAGGELTGFAIQGPTKSARLPIPAAARASYVALNIVR